MKPLLTLIAGFFTGVVLMAIGATLQKVALRNELSDVKVVSYYLSPDDLHYLECVKANGKLDRGIDNRTWCLVQYVPAERVEQLLPQ